MFYEIGDEIGLDGVFDPGCRKCMPWETIENQKESSLLSFHKQLIKLRKENSALVSSSLEFVKVPEKMRQNLVAFIRRVDNSQRKEGGILGAEKILVLFNNSSTETLNVDLKDTCFGISTPTSSENSHTHLRHLFQQPTHLSSSSSMNNNESMMINSSSENGPKRQRVARSRSLLISHEIGSSTSQIDTTIELGPFQFAIIAEETIPNLSMQTKQNSITA